MPWFLGAITFTPDDVPFSNLEFREAGGTLTATGCFKGWTSGWQRDTGQTEKSHTVTVIGRDGLPIVRSNTIGEHNFLSPPRLPDDIKSERSIDSGRFSPAGFASQEEMERK